MHRHFGVSLRCLGCLERARLAVGDLWSARTAGVKTTAKPRIPAAYQYLAVVIMMTMLGEARAASQQTVADVQCIVVGARLSASSDQRLKLSAQMLLAYYLGRIDGRSMKIDLDALIQREAENMTSADFRSAARRCGTEFSDRGAEIVRIGKSLTQLGK